MELEWDEAKSDACLGRRGFDFAFASRVFDDPARLVERDLRIGGRVFVVVYTPRHDRLRLISARKTNPREVRRYGDGPRDSNG
jgi:uncharacterized DUF497 family protein